MAERYKFHQCNQKEGEDVTKFASELRLLALVCGIKNYNTQRKLLSEECSFIQTMQIALADEASYAEVQQLHIYCNSVNITVSVVGDQRKGRASKFTSHKCTEHQKMQTNRKCYRCKGNHAPQDCTFKDATCHYCKKTGYIMATCRKKASTCNETHVVEAATVEKEECSLYSLKTNESCYKQPIMVRLKMNRKDVAIVVDTGTGVSSINERTMYALWPDNNRLTT